MAVRSLPFALCRPRYASCCTRICAFMQSRTVRLSVHPSVRTSVRLSSLIIAGSRIAPLRFFVRQPPPATPVSIPSNNFSFQSCVCPSEIYTLHGNNDLKQITISKICSVLMAIIVLKFSHSYIKYLTSRVKLRQLEKGRFVTRLEGKARAR